MNTTLYRLTETKALDSKARTITAWASRADVVDRDGELITAEAWQYPDSTAAFEKNSVLMAFHKYDALPLGKVTALDKNKLGLAFTAVFAKTAAAEEAFGFIKDTGLSSFSVGFIPKSSREMSVKEVAALGVDTAGARGDKIRVFDHVELLEISLAPVPSNPRATALGAAMLDGKVKSVELRTALEGWAVEVNKQDVDRAVNAAIRGIDFKGHVEAAVKENVNAARNRIWREHLRDVILNDWRARQKAEADETARRLKREQNNRLCDFNDPAQVESYIVAKLEEIDFEKLVDDQLRLAIAKRRGRVL